MIDQKLLAQLQAYMAKPENECDITEGATMLLRMTGNKILFNNIISKPEKHRERLFYNLRKQLKQRTDLLTCQQAQSMTKAVERDVAPILDKTAEADAEKKEYGKRPDHDQLHEDIQAIYAMQADIRAQMRDAHARLRAKATDEYPACQRHEDAERCLLLHKTYLENWKIYDAAQPGEAPSASQPTTADSRPSTVDTKRVQANRKYLSESKRVLPNLTGDKHAERLAETQLRYAELLSVDENLKPDQLQALVALGLEA